MALLYSTLIYCGYTSLYLILLPSTMDQFHLQFLNMALLHST